jgi:outer membrane protein assembly factor BamB
VSQCYRANVRQRCALRAERAGAQPCSRGRDRRVLTSLCTLAAILLAGCGTQAKSTSQAESTSVTVTRAPGGLGQASGGPLLASGANWSTLLRSPSHFGSAPIPGPATAQVRWQRHFEGSIVAGPVAVGGVAYVASTAGILYAIEISSGRIRWSFDGGGSYGSDLSTSPTVLADGLLLWPGPRHMLFALTAQGRLRWTLSEPSEVLTPAVDERLRTLVLADTGGGLSGADGRPALQWSRQLAGVSYGSPALGSDGTIYETAGDSLFALAPDGSRRWQVRTSAAVEVSAALSQDGTVVFASNDRYEYGVGPGGSVRWRYALGTFSYSSPVTLAGDRVVFANGDQQGYMNVLSTRDGHLIERDQVSGTIWTAAAVDAHGDVYFASRAGGIYGFAPGGRQLFAIQAGGTFASYPAIAADGTLLVGGDDGMLRAIG